MKKKVIKNKCTTPPRRVTAVVACSERALPPIEEVQELEEFHYGTLMTTSTDNVYLNGHRLGALPWAG
jgi:hypothetical protein